MRTVFKIKSKKLEIFDKHTKFKRWLYRMMKAVSAWEDDHAQRLVNDGFSNEAK